MNVLRLIFYFVCICTFFSCTNYDKLAITNYNEAMLHQPFDAIIVPGVPYKDSAMENIMKVRVQWSKYLYDRKIAKNIIYSGSAVYSPYVEAKAMRIIADSLGIPHEHTFEETKAEHSTENVYYSLQLAKSLGFKNIALATDPFQTKMTRKFIRKRCPEVKKIPVLVHLLDAENVPWPKIDPKTAFVPNFVSIVTSQSLFYRLKGTLGMNIKYENESSK